LKVRPPAGKRRRDPPKLAGVPEQVAPKQSDAPVAPARQQRSFLGPELAFGVQGNDEAPEFSLKMLLHDPKIRDLGLRLWRQFSGAGATSERDLGEAGLSFADLWKPGVTEGLTTSSTAEEVARYRLTLEYRAKFLEALLEETLADLERVVHMKPAASGDPSVLPQPALPHVHNGHEEGGSQGRKEA
jgi:hypothetical protein